ncbi:hypothetical protein ZIOFF_054130 [Zingiber officinale]|uniref:Autophagy-related protein 3 n=1 Tax=Zingiber officinale TaxID=94328 RepID=A0A8J5KQT5_ZINOF|nr:hypothetical protein ZIOFF_054130 [Zingiber officinale]
MPLITFDSPREGKGSSRGGKMVLSQKLHEVFKGTVERITGPRTVSAFKEKGVLSVSEFVIAGDNLVAKCPTWSWEAGEQSKRKSYLPANKQYLITRNVPCLRRASSVEEEYDAAGGEFLLGGDDDDDDNDGWLATHGMPKGTKSVDDEVLPSMESLDIRKEGAIKSIPSYFGGEEEDDIPDMADYKDSENFIEADPASAYFLCGHLDSFVNSCIGGSFERSVLLASAHCSTFQFKSQFIVCIHVTIEDHPHMPGKHASVHPCRHGAVMKKIIDVLISRGVEPEVDKYLFLFLKFIASVVPTIEYDYTMDFDLGSSSH